MLELLMILLGLNFTNTNTAATNAGKIYDSQTVSINLTANTDPGDTGGETQPIPPRK